MFYFTYEACRATLPTTAKFLSREEIQAPGLKKGVASEMNGVSSRIIYSVFPHIARVRVKHPIENQYTELGAFRRFTHACEREARMESRPNNHFFGFGYEVIEGLSPLDIVDISVTEIRRFKTCDFVSKPFCVVELELS